MTTRNCVKCGKFHDLILENTRTGERLEEMNRCHFCLADEWYGKRVVITKQVVLTEEENEYKRI